MKKMKLKRIDEKNVRIWIGIVIVLSILVIGGFLFLNRPSELDRLDAQYIDIVNKKVVKENVKNKCKETYKLKDYAIYGETLNLYNKKYNGKERDDTLGKIIVLRNLETSEEYTYTFTGGIDGGIPLGMLDEGFYEIYIYDHYIKKRLYFDEPLHSQPFSTMRRQGKVKNISLDANADLLEKLDIQLDKNYAFLTVVDSIPKVKVYDVVINPGGNVYNDAINAVETGAVSAYAEEPKEMMELAEKVKKLLTDMGLRVEISRDKDETSSYYGKNSRVGKGYNTQAKLYLNLAMVEDNNVTRPFIKASPQSNANLANEFAYTFYSSGIKMENMTANNALEWGVIYDTMYMDDSNEYTVFETQPELRETGGKCTYAGTLDFAKANADFDESYGMESVIIYLANVESEDSVKYYNKRKDEFAQCIARAILSYYEIGGNESEATD